MANEQQERDQVRRQLLGWGLQTVRTDDIDIGQDITLEANPDGTVDLATVEGIENLAQSLTIALTTALGSDIFNTGFGFDGVNALAEEPDPMLARERARISVVQLLRKDARVRRITDVTLDGDTLGPVPSGSRTLEVQVSFETVSFDQPTLQLGKVTPSA